MAKNLNEKQVARELREILEPVLPGIEVDLSYSDRWKRPQLTFCHPVFSVLLPEQRYHTLRQLIPPAFHDQYLAGVVWFELAPGETQEDLLKAPRSEDLAAAEPKLAKELLAKGFFEQLAERLGDDPDESCSGEFAVTRQVLAELGFNDNQQRDVCLVLIRNGGYCDCQVLSEVQTALSRYGQRLAAGGHPAERPSSRKKKSAKDSKR